MVNSFSSTSRLSREVVLLVAFLMVLGATALAQSNDVVYITKTGEKYHLGTCQYLRSSKFAIDKAEAAERGYTPCSVCRPGSATRAAPNHPVVHQEDNDDDNDNQSGEEATQCTAKTKAGTRCKRTTTNANGKCWQHQ